MSLRDIKVLVCVEGGSAFVSFNRFSCKHNTLSPVGPTCGGLAVCVCVTRQLTEEAVPAV